MNDLVWYIEFEKSLFKKGLFYHPVYDYNNPTESEQYQALVFCYTRYLNTYPVDDLRQKSESLYDLYHCVKNFLTVWEFNKNTINWRIWHSLQHDIWASLISAVINKWHLNKKLSPTLDLSLEYFDKFVKCVIAQKDFDYEHCYIPYSRNVVKIYDRDSETGLYYFAKSEDWDKLRKYE